MSITEFSLALNQVATERGIPVESVVESIKTALATAYKKDRKEHGEEVEIEEISVDLNQSTGEVRIIRDAKDVTPAGFGRIAAQTAKQVILQKIRETEKDVVYNEFKAKVGEIVLATVFRIANGVVTVDLGKIHAQGVMLPSEQVPSEIYRINQRLKVLIKEVRQDSKGTEIIVSRSDPAFIKKLFEQEVPEISSGVVVIESIAREAGSRTKMAVTSKDEKVDPVGSCVGQKGVRVQSIISEVFGEKIDIIPFSNITEKYIASSLSPARVADVELFEDEKRALVTVPEDQQSLAIGKEGQNARLANKLTHWKIDIKGTNEPLQEDVTSDDSAVSKSKKKKLVVGVWDSEIKKSEPEKKEADEVLSKDEVLPESEVLSEDKVLPKDEISSEDEGVSQDSIEKTEVETKE